MTPAEAQTAFTEFRANSDKVKALRVMLDSEIMREAFQLIDDLGPKHFDILPSTEAFASTQLGKIIGHQQWIDQLRMLATYPKMKADVPMDFKEGN